MQKNFEIVQGVPEIWGFKRLEMILLHETKKEEKIPLCLPHTISSYLWPIPSGLRKPRQRGVHESVTSNAPKGPTTGLIPILSMTNTSNTTY